MYKVSVSLEEAQIQSPFVSGGGTYYKTFILFLIKTHELKFFLSYYSDKNAKSGGGRCFSVWNLCTNG